METLKKRITGMAALAMLATTGLTGCGSASSSSMIDSMKLKIYQDGGDTYAQMTTAINTSGLILSGLDIPIYKNGDPSQVLGHLAIVNNFCLSSTNCSDSELQLSVNLSQVAHTSPAASTLPNGTSIPLSGLGSTQIVGLNIGSTNARLYVGMGSVTVLGVALPFEQLNGVGSTLPGVNIFSQFADASTGVKGIAGMFTGAQAGQTGFAVFVDATPFMPAISTSLKSLAQFRAGQSAVAASVSSARASSVGFVEMAPSRWEQYRLFGELSDLSRASTVLNLQ